MPMISQLPVAIGLAASDAVPVSQSGVARAIPVGALLAGTQPAILTSSGTLLGRRSLGTGGPEEIVVGSGLTLNDGTLNVDDGMFASLETVGSVSPGSRLIAIEDGRLKAVLPEGTNLSYTAGTHIEIDSSGVISAIWPEETLPGSFPHWGVGGAGTPTVASVAVDDLLPVLHNGTLGVVTYGQLLNGRTVDQLQPATEVNDGDHFLVAQGGSVMARQNFAGVWQWISEKLTSVRMPIVELTVNTTLDATVHSGRILVCTEEITITPVLMNLSSGFHCEVVNLSAGGVVLADPIVTAAGVGVLPAGAAATVRSIACSLGVILYASGFGDNSGSLTPDRVMNLRYTDISMSAVSVAWDAPVSGAAVAGYTLETRPVGTAAWTIRGDGVTATSFAILGLVPGLSYEIVVTANNSAGRGVRSSALMVAIPNGQQAPGLVTGLTATPQSSSSVSVSWSAPISGGAPTSYTMQYRTSGSSTWSHSIPSIAAMALLVSDLTPGTTFEFRTYAMNDGGAGPPTPVVAATTFPQAGAVASITWNLVGVGSYSSGVGSIGLNARVQPADASIRFGFSTSAVVAPVTWVVGLHVNTDFWAAYVPTPAAAGIWYSWVQGSDGSATVVHPTPFTVT